MLHEREFISRTIEDARAPSGSSEVAYLVFHTVAIQCLETAFGVTLEDSDLALPQTLPEIFEAATASKVSLGFP